MWEKNSSLSLFLISHSNCMWSISIPLQVHGEEDRLRDQRWLSDSHLSVIPFSISQLNGPGSLKFMLLSLSRRTR